VECTFVPILPSSTEEILRINVYVAFGLFYSKFLVHTKWVLHVRLCSTSTTATSECGIILMLSANVAVESASAPKFQRASSGTLQWDPAAIWQVDWSVIECYGDGSAGAALKCASSCEADFVVLERWSASTLVGKRPSMVESVISRKTTNCITSSVCWI